MKNPFPTAALALAALLLAEQPLLGQEAGAQTSYASEQENEPSEEFSRARELLRAQDFQGAERAFRAIVEADGEHGPAWFFLGYSLHVLKRYEEALAIDIIAARFEKHGRAALYNAGCASALLGRKEDAFAWIEKAFAAGFDNRELVKGDPDLDSLRDDPRLAQYLPAKSECAPFLCDVRVLFTFDGEASGDQFGWEGRNAGDCDGDGVSDILISAPYQSGEGTNAGAIYLFSGKSGELIFSRSGTPGQNLGMSIAAAGDVNADGFADVIAGAPYAGYKRYPGRAYVYSGSDGQTLHEFRTESGDDSFGWKVTGVGDMDGDGHADLAVGAPMSDASSATEDHDAGRVDVFSGRSGQLLFSVAGERGGDEAGTSVAGMVQADRRLLAVGACNAGAGRRGQVIVYRIDDLAPSPFFTIDADESGENLGRMFLSFVGDVNGDGALDVYASDWEHNARGRATGRVYVHSGLTGERLLTLTGEHAGDRFGVGSGSAGDVNADGCDDLIIGAWRSSQGAPSSGKCYVFSGRDGNLIQQYVSTTPGDAFGFDAVGMGDLDGDGGEDFLITSAWNHANGRRAGRALVIAGPLPEACSESPAQVASDN